MITPLVLSAFLGSATGLELDTLEQHIRVDVTAPPLLTVDSDIVLEALEPTDRLLIMTPPVPIESVDVGGTLAAWEPHPSYPNDVVQIVFPEPLVTGGRVTVHLVLSGDVDCRYRAYPSYTWCEHTSEGTVLMADSNWHYANPFAADPFVGSVSVTATSDVDVVAGIGSATVEDLGNGTSVSRFELSVPVVMFPLYAGAWPTATSSEGFPVTGYYKGDAAAPYMQTMVDLAAKAIPFYGDLYAPIPTSEANIISVPITTPVGGMGLLGTIMINEYIFTPSGAYLVEQGAAHEFAHTWWGHLASAEDPWSDGGFLTEAFAEYSAWRFLGSVWGHDARVSGMRMNATWYMYGRPSSQDIAIRDPNIANSDLRVFSVYHKGSMVLRALEAAVGEQAFTEALRRFLERGNGGLTVAGLVEDIAAVSGYDATADMEQWLDQRGFPRLSIGTRLTETELTLVVEMDQSYALDVPVELVFADGSREQHIGRVETGVNALTFPITRRPALIRVDPEWTLVREVEPFADGDVTLDGDVDGADLIEVALHADTLMPDTRRVDGGYDRLFDVDHDGYVDVVDLTAVRRAAAE